MNDNVIFVKTASGEDAVRDRTRLVQRNLRMVLILVDGVTNVFALKQKAGDPAMIETALAELERIGLIESTKSHGVRQTQTVSDVFSAPAAALEETPSLDSFDGFPTVDTVFEGLVPSTNSGPIADEAALHTKDAITSSEPQLKRDAPPSEGWLFRLRKRWHQVWEERAYEKAYGMPISEEGEVATLPKRFRAKQRIKLKPILLVAIPVGLAIAIARVIFYPYDEYRPAFEAHLSKMLAEPTSIGSIVLEFSPMPTLAMRQVTVGSDASAVADVVSITPAPTFLLGGELFHSAKVNGLHLKEAAIPKLGRWFLPDNMGSIRLDRIQIDGLSLDLGWTQLQGLSGSLRPGQGSVASFSGQTEKGELQYEVIPAGPELSISVRTGTWMAPTTPSLSITAMDFSGRLGNRRLVLEKIDARVFDGIVSGSGLVTWDQGAPGVTLGLAMKHVSTGKLLEALQAPALAEGELVGQFQYVSSNPSMRWLTQDAKATGTVTIVHGDLKRMDLAGALRNGGSQQNAVLRGGETGFENLSAKVSIDAASVRVTDVRLASGLMLASGQATFNRATGGVAGVATVEMRGSERAPRASIAIGGSGRDPELKIAR